MKTGYVNLRKRLIWGIGLALLLVAVPAWGQPFDLLLKGGHVIDPKNGIDAPRDVAIKGNRIARVAPEIPAAESEKVVDVTGYYVTPGLIDIHTHVFVGPRTGAFANGFSSVSPDAHAFRAGVTTMVDAGTSGWRNFPVFKEHVIDPSKTRVLAFLNIVGHGMWDDAHNQDLGDMNPEKTAAAMKKHSDLIVGVKIGHYRGAEWTPFGRALGAAELAGTPLLLECHLPELPLEALLDRMRPGDIFTHAFGDVGDRTSVVNAQGNVRAYVREAKARGIVFDVGHGGGSFHYGQAVPALEQGLTPDTFGTDLHRWSMNSGMKNMLNIMSKYLNMGMSVDNVVRRATWNAARALQREDLGHLSEGAVADVAVLRVRNGTFGFVDAGGQKMTGDQKFEAELTVRGGEIVWDLNGLAAPTWDQ